MHLPTIPRFLVRWSIRLVLLVIFIGLPVAIIYFREVGIGYGLKDRVAAALTIAHRLDDVRHRCLVDG